MFSSCYFIVISCARGFLFSECNTVSLSIFLVIIRGFRGYHSRFLLTFIKPCALLSFGVFGCLKKAPLFPHCYTIKKSAKHKPAPSRFLAMFLPRYRTRKALLLSCTLSFSFRFFELFKASLYCIKPCLYLCKSIFRAYHKAE